MNLSGEAVKKLVIKYRIKPEDLIVIHDEMDLRLGIIRIRRGGSSAGHNGVESIIRDLGTADFVRIRVGVGHPRDTEEGQRHVIGYVLGDFAGDEAEVIKKVISEVDKAVVTFIEKGLDAAMNRFNKTNAPKKDKTESKENAGASQPSGNSSSSQPDSADAKRPQSDIQKAS
jgi:PTH1 family peptidyl-tRNA hydrolase